MAHEDAGQEPAADRRPHPLHLLQRHLVDTRRQARLLLALSRKVGSLLDLG